MKKERHDVLIQIYKKLDEAEERQKQRGVYDQGARSRVTSGKHLHPVTKVGHRELGVVLSFFLLLSSCTRTGNYLW